MPRRLEGHLLDLRDGREWWARQHWTRCRNRPVELRYAACLNYFLPPSQRRRIVAVPWPACPLLEFLLAWVALLPRLVGPRPSRWEAIDRYIAEGKLRAYRVAGEKTIRIKREDVDALLSPIAGERHVAETRDEHTLPRTGR